MTAAIISQQRLEEFMDRLAIRELVDRYVDRLNHRDWDEYEKLITEDFVFTTSAPINRHVATRKGMMEFLKGYQSYSYGFVFQMNHGLVIEELAGDRARTHHTLQVFSDTYNMIGIYYDIVVREADGQWRFKRRDFQITYREDVKAPGKSFRLLPDPHYRELPRD